jgi:hypothetical protein
MLNFNDGTLHVEKARVLMGGWGLLILLAAIVNQFFELPNPNYVLLLWTGVTVLGILAHITSLIHGLGQNFGAWVVVIVIGWAFTFYVVKFDNGAHIDLYGDLAGVWLILLGISYLATAYHVARPFLIFAGLHIVAGVLLELSARGITRVSFLDTYSTLIFGLVAGLPLLIAALPQWYRAEAPQASPAVVESQIQQPGA